MDKILLFIPMYNCEKQIVRVLGQLKGEADDHISQVIVVNNRSTDNGEKAVIDWLCGNKLTVPVTLLRNAMCSACPWAPCPPGWPCPRPR